MERTLASPLFASMLRHEWRLFRADGLLAPLTLLLVLGVGYALYNGHAWLAKQQGTTAAALADERTRIAKLEADLAAMNTGTWKPRGAFEDPSSALRVGNRLGATVAALPSAPLAATAIGQSDLYPPYVEVSADNKDTFLFGEEIENPANLLTGAFDLSFVIVFLLPLLALALGYNLVSGEREQGTLSMLLSNPVRLAQVLRAKVAFRGAVVLLLVLAVSIGGLLLGGAPLFTAAGLASLACWALLVAAYGLFWFVLAVLVNLFGRNSAQNALILVGLWIAASLIAPTLIGIAANVAYPVPARAEMINNLRAAQTALANDADATLTRFYQEHPEMDPSRIAPDSDHSRGVRRLALQQAASARVAAEIARYDGQLDRQQAVVDWLRFLSPAIVMQQALNDVAGTGTRRYKEFTAQVNAFHAQWQGFFQPKVLSHHPLLSADYAKFPKFAYRDGESPLGDIATSLFGLLLPTAVLALWAQRRLSRHCAS